MKPVIGMEDQKSSNATVIVQSTGNVENGKNGKSKMIKGVVIGIVCFVIMAAVIVVSMYIGHKLTKDTYKTALTTFEFSTGKRIEENITVTENEMEVHVPNEMNVIYDYEHAIVVYRHRDAKTKLGGKCYAKPMTAEEKGNRTTSSDPGAKTIKVPAVGNSRVHIFVKSKDEVPEHMLSDRVRDMCKDTEVYWYKAADADGGLREKRQATCACSVTSEIHYYGFCLPFNSDCPLYCYQEWICPQTPDLLCWEDILYCIF